MFAQKQILVKGEFLEARPRNACNPDWMGAAGSASS